MRFYLALALAVSAATVGCTKKEGNTAPTPTADATATQVAASSEASKVTITDTTEGSGAAAEAGKMVTIHYVGSLADGSKFDSSRDRSKPFTFKLGQGQVIPGLDRSLTGMKVGGKRKLTIPPELGYGPNGVGKVIPPNATLTFDIELLSVDEPVATPVAAPAAPVAAPAATQPSPKAAAAKTTKSHKAAAKAD